MWGGLQGLHSPLLCLARVGLDLEVPHYVLLDLVLMQHNVSVVSYRIRSLQSRRSVPTDTRGYADPGSGRCQAEEGGAAATDSAQGLECCARGGRGTH